MISRVAFPSGVSFWGRVNQAQSHWERKLYRCDGARLVSPHGTAQLIGNNARGAKNVADNKLRKASIEPLSVAHRCRSVWKLYCVSGNESAVSWVHLDKLGPSQRDGIAERVQLGLCQCCSSVFGVWNIVLFSVWIIVLVWPGLEYLWRLVTAPWDHGRELHDQPLGAVGECLKRWGSFVLLPPIRSVKLSVVSLNTNWSNTGQIRHLPCF